MAWAAVVGGVISIGGGLLASGKAKRAAKAAKRDQRAAQARINSIKAQRQAVTNPYAGSSDLSGMASDLSGMISNPFAQLGVATEAAEIQMEQSDIALANTLDTLRSTGAGAGGATALAQAALQSKKGISANIEQQEAQNEKLKAQGEASANQQKMSEAQRQQGIAISEGQRMQSNEAAGKQFVFQQNEQRTNADLDRAAGGLDQARANEASANQASASAISGMIGAVGNIATTAVAGASAQGVADTNLETAKVSAMG
jgi:hypothetical protein